MTKIIVSLTVAGILAGAFASPAVADGRNAAERSAWYKTATENYSDAARLPLGAIPSSGVSNSASSLGNVRAIEPYIARQIEKDRRGRGH